MKQIIYRFIYNNRINPFLRKLNKSLSPILPGWFRLPPSGTITLNVEGKKLRMATNQTSYLTQFIFWQGYRNFEYTDIFLRLINKVDRFYDIGANIGYYSLLAACVNPNIRVRSFEPAEGPLYYLKKNAAINNFNNIIIEDIALSDKTGETEFYEVKNKKYTGLKYNLAGEGNVGTKTTNRNYIKTTVKTITLDSYVDKHEKNDIQLIKMDTEGNEHLILGSSSKVLQTMKPVIICETLFNTIEDELEHIMKSHHYEFYDALPGGLVKKETIKRASDNQVRNCFFVHPSKRYLIEEFIGKE